MSNFVTYCIILAVFICSVIWAGMSTGKETTPLDEALERPIKVEKIETDTQECLIITKHNHTFVRCVPK
jgi:hypothetical protein